VVVEEGTVAAEDLQGDGEKVQQGGVDEAESTAEGSSTDQQNDIEAAFEKKSSEEADTTEQQDGVEGAAEAGAEDAEAAAEQQDGMEESNLDDLILSLMRAEEGAVMDDTATAGELAKAAKFKQALSDLLQESRAEQDGGGGADPAARVGGAWAKSKSGEAEPAPPHPQDEFESVEDDSDELLGMILTVRNEVDGAYVERPTTLAGGKKWSVEYSIQTMAGGRSKTLYAQAKARRRRMMADGQRDRDAEWHLMFGRSLPHLSDKGRKHRVKEEEWGRDKPVWVVGEEGPKKWEDVFGKK
ncbi:hypothetical protein IMZ48_20900, partial [Candidatus Bathyarchaeota archaeon]|nr:hypothetical protein [Candidatus Bathyarchaeota archaeon]